LDRRVVAALVVVVVVALGATGYLLTTPSHATGATSTTSGSPTVSIAYKAGIGNYLVNGSGFTLYYRTTDIQSNGTSTCSGTCVKNWPVFYTSNLVLPSGLNASSFKVVIRSDGLKQLTYDGWPLYFFIGDKQAGNTNGQGIGGIWFAYSLGGATGSTTTATSTTSSVTTTTARTSTTCYYYCG
jgi:predicted lipoprotein with Yx(FWY)xxD motif